MLARDSSGMINSLGDSVKTTSALDTRFIGRAFITDVIMSMRWSKSVENKLLFKRVSQDLKTLIDDSTKFANCSLPCLGLISHPGQGLFMATEQNVACASVIISSGCAYLMNRTCNAEMSDLALRSYIGRQKK